MSPVDILGITAGLAIVTTTLTLASRRSHPHLVTTSTTLITIALIAAWLAAPQHGTELAPLIGTGLGALAAALAATTRPANPKPIPTKHVGIEDKEAR